MTYPAQFKQKGINLRQQGKSLREISSQLNISKSTASVWLRNLKLNQQAKKTLEQKRQNRFFKPGNIHWQKAKDKANFTRWTSEKLDQLKKLYCTELSMKQVGEQMNCSTWAISSAMKRYNIKRRTSSHSNKIRFYNSPLSFKPKQNLTLKEKQLKTTGLMLYWAEGSKKNPHHVDFANSDPLMIKLFIKFLREICRVNESRLRCLIYCYPSHNIQELTSHWSRLTNIPKPQFTKPYIRQDGGNIRDKMKYGLVHIRYSDKRLFELIMKEIKQISYNI
jgi:predicted DNA-binding protein YlxM (UPF0122 family)